MYTSLELNCEMRDKPQLMDHLLGYEDVIGAEFECNLFNYGGHFHNYGKPQSEFYKEDGYYYLAARFNLKNYQSQIQEVLDYLHIYMECDDGDWIGTYRYEEDELPTLLIYRDDYIEFKEVE